MTLNERIRKPRACPCWRPGDDPCTCDSGNHVGDPEHRIIAPIPEWVRLMRERQARVGRVADHEIAR